MKKSLHICALSLIGIFDFTGVSGIEISSDISLDELKSLSKALGDSAEGQAIRAEIGRRTTSPAQLTGVLAESQSHYVSYPIFPSHGLCQVPSAALVHSYGGFCPTTVVSSVKIEPTSNIAQFITAKLGERNDGTNFVLTIENASCSCLEEGKDGRAVFKPPLFRPQWALLKQYSDKYGHAGCRNAPGVQIDANVHVIDSTGAESSPQLSGSYQLHAATYDNFYPCVASPNNGNLGIADARTHAVVYRIQIHGFPGVYTDYKEMGIILLCNGGDTIPFTRRIIASGSATSEALIGALSENELSVGAGFLDALRTQRTGSSSSSSSSQN